MLTWVIYDISEDRIRGKIADTCLNAGMYRVQKSCYAGELLPIEVNELAVAIEALIPNNSGKDAVYVIPTCREDFKKARFLGCSFDVDLVCDRVTAVFI